ncbi:hypothetical protein AAVH_05022 [Aphelenchoides avenae]|nr:hypothetical protein AAVH_05022 [Aphelenchus avenae]
MSSELIFWGSLPPQKPLEPGVLCAVVQTCFSQLEFNVIRSTDLPHFVKIKSELASLHESIVKWSVCQLENGASCTVERAGQLHRARIELVGKNDAEVLVKLVDYGTTAFIPGDKVYGMPESIACIAPPLSYKCSLSSADSRDMDDKSVRHFCQLINATESLILNTHGCRNAYGREVVDVLEKVFKPGVQIVSLKPAQLSHGGHTRRRRPREMPPTPSRNTVGDPTVCS